MKDIIRLLLKFSFVILIFYGVIFSFFILKENEYGLVRDNNTGSIIEGFKERYNFIWRGGMPWKYKVDKIDLQNSSLINVVIQIPSLSLLTDEIYYIRIPMNISYMLKKDNLPDISFLTGRKDLDQYISTVAAGICRTMLSNSIDPVYDRNLLLKEQARLNDDIAAEIIKKLSGLGIAAEKIEFILPGYYPDTRLYEEALVMNREMKEINFNSKKQEILLKKQLLKERSEFELYMEKLNKVSAIIKDNPLILKYIYIDKMGDNIKVIISSDKTGIPAMIGESEEKSTPSGKTGDIDNLR